MRFSTGFDHYSARYGDLFFANAHLSRALILVDGREVARVGIGPNQRSSIVDLNVVGTSLRIVADNVYAGRRWQDVCLSEVIVLGESAPATRAAAHPFPSNGRVRCTITTLDDFHLDRVRPPSTGGVGCTDLVWKSRCWNQPRSIAIGTNGYAGSGCCPMAQSALHSCRAPSAFSARSEHMTQSRPGGFLLS